MGVPVEREERGWARRLGWLALYWLAGVATMGAVAVLLRALMQQVGMGS